MRCTVCILFVAACNAAQRANPENPIAAAESLPELLKALWQVRSLLWTMADEAGNVPLWNKGGAGYEAFQVVMTAIDHAEGRLKVTT